MPANQEELRRQQSGGLKPWNPSKSNDSTSDVKEYIKFEGADDLPDFNDIIDSYVAELREKKIEPEPDEDSEATGITVWKYKHCSNRECKVRVKSGYHGFVKKSVIKIEYRSIPKYTYQRELGTLYFTFGTSNTGQTSDFMEVIKGHNTGKIELATDSGEKQPNIWKRITENPDFFDSIQFKFNPFSGTGTELYLQDLRIELNGAIILHKRYAGIQPGFRVVPYQTYDISADVKKYRKTQVFNKVVSKVNHTRQIILDHAAGELGKAWGPKYCMPARDWTGLITSNCCDHFIKWALSEAGFCLNGCYAERNGFCLNKSDIDALNRIGITDYSIITTLHWMRDNGLIINEYEGHKYSDLGNANSKSFIRPGYVFALQRGKDGLGHSGIFLGWENPNGEKHFNPDNYLEEDCISWGMEQKIRVKGNRFWAISNTGSRAILSRYTVYDAVYIDFGFFIFAPRNAICWGGILKADGTIDKRKNQGFGKTSNAI